MAYARVRVEYSVRCVVRGIGVNGADVGSVGRHVSRLRGGGVWKHLVDTVHAPHMFSLLRFMGATLLKEQQRNSKVNRLDMAAPQPDIRVFPPSPKSAPFFPRYGFVFQKRRKTTKASVPAVVVVGIPPAPLAGRTSNQHTIVRNKTPRKKVGSLKLRNLEI
jgi:hypothetical protein